MDPVQPVTPQPNLSEALLAKKRTPPAEPLGFLDRLVGSVKNTSSFGGAGDSSKGDVYSMLFGMDASQLKNLGKLAYPETPPGSQHHSMASYLMAMQGRNALAGVPGGEAASILLPQIAGLGVEAVEGTVQAAAGLNPFRKDSRTDTWNDLKANLAGALDAHRRTKAAKVAMR